MICDRVDCYYKNKLNILIKPFILFFLSSGYGHNIHRQIDDYFRQFKTFFLFFSRIGCRVFTSHLVSHFLVKKSQICLDWLLCLRRVS